MTTILLSCELTTITSLFFFPGLIAIIVRPLDGHMHSATVLLFTFFAVTKATLICNSFVRDQTLTAIVCSLALRLNRQKEKIPTVTAPGTEKLTITGHLPLLVNDHASWH
jgi:hypothetical protein